MKGLSEWGQVTWNGPVTVSLPGDRVFDITLSDETFNWGFGGLNEGMMCGATISATITQVSSFTPDVGRPGDVPDNGNTIILFGIALLVIAISRQPGMRRIKKVVRVQSDSIAKRSDR